MRRRKRLCPLSTKGAPEVDYKNIRLLQRFLTAGGRVLPSRVTGVSAKKQKLLVQAVKRARYMALIPYLAPAPAPTNPLAQ